MRARTLIQLGIAVLIIGGCMVDNDAKDSAGGAAKTASKGATTTATSTTPDDKTTGLAMSKDEMSTKADIPLYPGSDVPEGQSNVTKQGAETRYELDMDTSDNPDKVADFFKSKMKVDKSANGGQIDMLGDTAKGNLAQITISKKDGKTHIKAVSLVEGK